MLECKIYRFNDKDFTILLRDCVNLLLADIPPAHARLTKKIKRTFFKVSPRFSKLISIVYDFDSICWSVSDSIMSPSLTTL